ncbi:MAG TPA: hypothetical protein VFG42_00825 [Baekduia sp.]|uniref:hypothetical protein n=1 Tax=Baekduia sp. TaxID=2600305 RepID=UPI002D786BFC|nr:hypothetical protein [Baekduia sp.]HET6505303.1 hypothetical protein [Baekduia sp.]
MRRAVIRGLAPLAAVGALVVPGIAHAQERVVEPVSPARSQGTDVNDASGYNSLDGNMALWADEFFVADVKTTRRTATGWTTPSTLDAQLNGAGFGVQDLSPDGSAVVWNELSPYAGIPGYPQGLFTIQDGHISQLAVWDSALDPSEAPSYLAGSKDLSRLVVRASAGQLTATTSNSGLYRWSADGYEPIDIDMSRYSGATCADPLATLAMRENGQTGISADGSTLVVATPACTVGSPATPVPSHLVLWHDGTSTDITTPVSGGADGNAAFVGRSPDASRIYFTTAAKLQASDTNGATDLYVWERGQLTRITDGVVTAGQTQASRDGSTVWFEADQPLGGSGQAGKPNIFLWDDGALHFVGTYLTAPLLKTFGGSDQSQLTSDGRTLVYGGATTDPVTGAFHGIQLTRIGRDGVSECVSCPPAGVTADTSFPLAPAAFAAAIWRPFVSEDGKTIVFITKMALDPRDTNGLTDTYAWEDGKQVLISSGTGTTPGVARGMTPDGSSIFFQQGGTQNVPGVTDIYQKLWVSRIGGGFPVQQTPDPCGTACQGPLAPAPSLPVAASVTFAGPGNLVPPAQDEPVSSTPTVTKPSGTVRGTSALVRVKVPGGGVIRISGARVGTAKRTVLKAGTYSVRVALTKAWQRSLARHSSITAALKVQFTPVDGQAGSKTVQLKFAKKATKKATSKKAAR